MNDIVLIILVLGISLGSLIGVASWLQKRYHKHNPGEAVQPTDPVSKIWLWWIRILTLVLVSLVLATVLTSNLIFLWIALSIVVVGYILGFIYRILRATRLKNPKN